MNTITIPARESDDRWNQFAKRDAYSYIMTNLSSGDPAEFWASGKRTVDGELIPLIEEYKVKRTTAIEIGCGVGRLLIPLSRYFDSAVGVDISAEMLRRARTHALEHNADNTLFVQVGARNNVYELMPNLVGTVAFAYSLLVFQHIDSFNVIRDYVQSIALLLTSHGVAYIQFDTRKKSPLYAMRGILPDLFLPQYWRKGIRRIRRAPDELKKLFAQCGLRMLRESGVSSDYHCFVLTKTPLRACEDSLCQPRS